MTTKKALAAEAKDSPIEFEYDNESYVVPHPKFWPLEVAEAQEAGRFAEAVRELLGIEQYKKFKKKPRVLQDLDDIVEAAFKVAELDAGKSQD